jgi:hypothetical protein
MDDFYTVYLTGHKKSLYIRVEAKNVDVWVLTVEEYY